ncbi:MAG: DUF4851 domain-containing protein [Mailhella sp.]|nr:DUF4851 domain-containing protein [Mailhella sp.]
MKKILLCALLAAVTMLAGCSVAPLQRGLDPASGAFVSTARPAMSIQPAAGFNALASGATLCRVPIDNALIGGVTTEVWFSLYKKDGAQLVAIMAECDPYWDWNVSAMGKDYYYLPLLYDQSGTMVGDAKVVAYVRSAARDPWMPQYVADGSGWEKPMLVAQYEWVDASDCTKVIAEYREPLEAYEEGMTIPAEEVTAFIQRARSAFSLGAVQQPVAVSKNHHVRIPDQFLAPIIGSVAMPIDFEPL